MNTFIYTKTIIKFARMKFSIWPFHTVFAIKDERHSF
jgi:hypothetical protein